MAFQFSCPQGHVLESEETYAGQPCQCPYCGITFVIPAPPRVAAPPTFPPMTGIPASPSVTAPGWIPPGGAAPEPSGATPAMGPPFAPGPRFAPQPAEPELLHIACPNGHELETPRDMLNQDVLCPHCNVQFRLREKDSIEYKRRRQQELERRERKAGQMWLNYAIVAAVLVVLGILGLIFMSLSGS